MPGPLLAAAPGRLWWRRGCGSRPAQNHTLSAHVHGLPFLPRSQHAFHLVSVLQVLLSVFYGNKTIDSKAFELCCVSVSAQGRTGETCAS